MLNSKQMNRLSIGRSLAVPYMNHIWQRLQGDSLGDGHPCQAMQDAHHLLMLDHQMLQKDWQDLAHISCRPPPEFIAADVSTIEPVLYGLQ